MRQILSGVKLINRVERWACALARLSAIAGGLVLLAVMLMTVISVAGLSISKFALWLKKSHDIIIEPLLAIGPIPGETELIETGMAFIIFAFMPLVTLNRGHASVEILTNAFSNGINRLIDLVADILLLVVAAYLTYRHYLGTLDKYGYGETTWILQFPLWWGYAAALVGAVIFVIICVFCVARSFNYLVTGRQRPTSGVFH